MSDSILQRELDEAKAFINATYWHLFQTTENLLKEITRLSSRNTQLVEEIDDLEVEAREKNAWEGRYWALLEECEASRPRTVEGDGSDLPVGTVVLDGDEAAWQRTCSGIWELVGGAYDLRETLSLRWAPYVIIYTPTPKENTNE